MQWLFDMFREQILGQVLAYVIPLVVATVVTWAGVLYSKVTGRELEKKHRDTLEVTITNAVRWAIQQRRDGKLSPQGTVPADKKAAVIAEARNYVKTSAPDALKFFDMSEGKLEQKILSKMPIQGDAVKAVK